MRRRHLIHSHVAMPLLVSCVSCKGEPTASSGPARARITIAVIPKGTTHEFWKSVHAGAVKASRELDVDILWKGPLKEDDLKGQVDVVEGMIAQGVAGIVLAPLNDKALVNPVKAAVAAKIPVVVFDSDLAGKDYVSFVATDNAGAGKLAAQHMAELLGGRGKVVVLRYQEGSASTAAREAGFLSTIREAHQDVVIVSDNQYGGATTESAFSAGENLLAANKAAEGGVDGVFCPNESTTFGMLLALQKAGLDGKVKLVGFDASEKLLKGLRGGQIDGLVVQSPFAMGETAVRTVVASLRGQKVEARIDTGVRVVTKKNLDDPGVQALVHPDLKKWLGE